MIAGRVLAAACLCFAGAARADETIRAGAYEVAFSLELPHVAPMAGDVATVCLVDPATRGLPVLSANNPLARCPASEVRVEGRELSFRIACPGPNAAKASALFDLRDGAFEGRIAMNMGGKNMTMTEVQRGRRVGDCAAAAPKP